MALPILLTLALAVQGVQIPAPPRGFSDTEADMVVDEAHVLGADAVARMNRVIFAVKRASGGEIVVVTMPDIGGREVGDIALRIGREWKVGANATIGDRSRNAGVVVLLVPKETASDGRGQISIQTGQGAEGFITDAMAGDIRREAIPFLRAADYGSALALITQRLGERYATEFGFALDSSVVDERFARGPPEFDLPQVKVTPGMVFVGLVLVFLFLVVLGNMLRTPGGRGCLYAIVANSVSSGRGYRGHSSWGGGGFGGGSWGGGGGFGGFGGGGGFSGGGSSGSW